MNFEFHPQAQQELEDAVNYYDGISEALGDQFILEIQKTWERIENFPEAWPQLSKNTHKCRVLTFPYGVIYQLKETEIFIIAIMHLQRQPNYWVDRK